MYVLLGLPSRGQGARSQQEQLGSRGPPRRLPSFQEALGPRWTRASSRTPHSAHTLQHTCCVHSISIIIQNYLSVMSKGSEVAKW